MRGNEFLDKMELIDASYMESADAMPKKKKRIWLQRGAAAACLCLAIGAMAMLVHFGNHHVDPKPGEMILSNKSTAKVSYGYADHAVTSSKGDLEYLTEEEMFARNDMYVFRGKVSGLTNVTIDFNGEKEARCIATIVMEKVYQGELVAGDSITMLIPCAVDIVGSAVEDTGVIAQLKTGMEGIFMPWIYDENSYMEMNGAVLIKQDLASCGLADGMRWAFLDTERGLVFSRDAYPRAKDAKNLDEIEAYVMDMLQ